MERIKTDAIAMAKLAKKNKYFVQYVYNNYCSFPWKKLGYAYHATQQARKVVGKAWYTEFAATPTRWWVTIDEENETIKHFVDVGFGESAIHPLWYKFDTLHNDSRRNGIRLLRQGRQKLGAQMARHQDMLTLLANNYNEMVNGGGSSDIIGFYHLSWRQN